MSPRGIPSPSPLLPAYRENMSVCVLTDELILFGQVLRAASKVDLELGNQVVRLRLDLAQVPRVLLVLSRELLQLLLDVELRLTDDAEVSLELVFLSSRE